MATVTATYTNAAGAPASGEVYLSPAVREAHDVTIITEQRVWASLDVNGSVSIEVLASDDPAWKTTGEVAYLVEERLTHVPFRSYYVTVPTAGLNLADAHPVEVL